MSPVSLTLRPSTSIQPHPPPRTSSPSASSIKRQESDESSDSSSAKKSKKSRRKRTKQSRKGGDDYPKRQKKEEHDDAEDKDKDKNPKDKRKKDEKDKKVTKDPKEVKDCQVRSCTQKAVHRELSCRTHCSMIRAASQDAARQGGDQLKKFKEARKKGGDQWLTLLETYENQCAEGRGFGAWGTEVMRLSVRVGRGGGGGGG